MGLRFTLHPRPLRPIAYTLLHLSPYSLQLAPYTQHLPTFQPSNLPRVHLPTPTFAPTFLTDAIPYHFSLTCPLFPLLINVYPLTTSHQRCPPLPPMPRPSCPCLPPRRHELSLSLSLTLTHIHTRNQTFSAGVGVAPRASDRLHSSAPGIQHRSSPN